jgi:hypothetical protein
MTDSLRASPVELVRTADQMLASSQDLADSWSLQQDRLTVPESAFGDVDVAADIFAGYAGAAEEGNVTVGRLVATLEADLDRLYRIAFAYQQTDLDGADRIAGLGSNRPI